MMILAIIYQICILASFYLTIMASQTGRGNARLFGGLTLFFVIVWIMPLTSP